MGRLPIHAPWDQPLACTPSPTPAPTPHQEDTMTTPRNPILIKVQEHYAAAASVTPTGAALVLRPREHPVGHCPL